MESGVRSERFHGWGIGGQGYYVWYNYRLDVQLEGIFDFVASDAVNNQTGYKYPHNATIKYSFLTLWNV